MFFKRLLYVTVGLVISFCIYAMIVNRNSPDMTIKQKILKAIYPALIWVSKKTGKNTSLLNTTNASPFTSFYTIRATLTDGTPVNLADYKGKKILVVNTASDCGYTRQYEDLQKLYLQFKDKLAVIGCPANDFKEQEKSENEAIASFCKLNYGVEFPLLSKGVVTKAPGQQPIFEWLTDKQQNGWNEQAPTWNFCKYLIDENGRLTNFFATSVEPLDNSLLNAISK